MNYDTCRIIIDWNSLVQEITDIDGTNPRNIDWNIPHALYKSNEPIDPKTAGLPQVWIPKDQFEYIDENITYDTVYYYRLSEMLPGGEHFTEQVKFEIKHHILKYEAPYLANIEYNGGLKDNTGILYKYDVLDLTNIDADGNPIEVLKPEWYWDGVGRISEWLEFIINDEIVDIRMRSSFSKIIKNITLSEDRRNYPAGRIDTMPVMATSIPLGADNLVQTPYWWAEWHQNVNEYRPDTWRNFWISRMGEWDDTEQWYRDDWVLNNNKLFYGERPSLYMDDDTVEPYVPEIRDLVLRADIGSTLSDGLYTGYFRDFETHDLINGTVNGIPRPGNQVGVGMGATLTFKNVRYGIKNGATISFRYKSQPYTLTIDNIPDYGFGTEELKNRLQTAINNLIGIAPDDAIEPFIAVSFGPKFNVI